MPALPTLDNQFQLYDFKGLNINVPKDMIEENQLSRANNVLIRDGNIMKRPGIKLWASWPFAEVPGAGQFGRLIFLGIFGTNTRAEFYFYDTSRNSIYNAIDGISLVKKSGTSNIEAVISNMLTPKNATVLTRPYLAIKLVNDFRVVTVNNFDMADGPVTVIANCTNAPAKLLDHLDRLWIAQGDAVSYSDPGVAQWTTLGIQGGTKNTITLPDIVWDIASYQDKILILTTDNLYALSIAGSPRNWSLQRIWGFSKKLDEFLAPPQLSPLDSNAPPDAKNFVELDGKIYFVHPEGLFYTDGATVQKLSTEVDPYFNQASNHTMSQINLSIFSYRKKELIIKLTGSVQEDVDNQIKYLIFNTVSGAWSKWELGLVTPPSAPIFNPAIWGSTLDGIPHYTYDLVGFFHLFASVYDTIPTDYTGSSNQENYNRRITGTFAMTSHITNEPNKFYMFPDYYDQWIYDDAGILYESLIETKTFDFGYRGSHKKCSKAFLSIDVEHEVDIVATHVVNNDYEFTRTKPAKPNWRMRKIAGPGYFLEWALRLHDSLVPGEKHGGWRLEALGLDMFNKSEQHQQTGS